MKLKVLILTLVFLTLSVMYDAQTWPFEDHTSRLILRVVVLGGLSFLTFSVWPFFLFFALFDPCLNLVRDLNIWYVGDTAIYDQQIKLLFGQWAGQITFSIELVAAFIFFILNTNHEIENRFW